MRRSSPSWDYPDSLPAEEARGCGEIGIRTGLKILRCESTVRVQAPPSPPLVTLFPHVFHQGRQLGSSAVSSHEKHMRTVDLDNWEAVEPEISNLFKKYPWASKPSIKPILFRGQSDASWKLQTTLEFKEMGSGLSIDLSRRPTNALPTWHSRLESSRLTSGFPLWRGNLRKISVF